MIAPGVAAQKAPDPEERSLDGAMDRDGVMAEYGTTGLETAMGAQKRGERDLVDPNQAHQNPCGDVPDFLPKVQDSASASSIDWISA